MPHHPLTARCAGCLRLTLRPFVRFTVSGRHAHLVLGLSPTCGLRVSTVAPELGSSVERGGGERDQAKGPLVERLEMRKLEWLDVASLGHTLWKWPLKLVRETGRGRARAVCPDFVFEEQVEPGE